MGTASPPVNTNTPASADQLWCYWTTDPPGNWHLIPDTAEALDTAINEGARYVTVLAVDRPPEGGGEPRYYGPLYLDLDSKYPHEAHRDCVAFLRLLESQGVDLQYVRAYATGGKGFHIEIPPAVLGVTEPLPRLPHIYREVVKLLTANHPLPTLDLGVYSGGRGRMWRLPNLRRQNGRFKVPVTAAEVFHLSFDEIWQLTASPRQVPWPDDDPDPAPALVEAFAKACTTLEERESAEAVPIDDFREQHPPCLGLLASGKFTHKTGQFNRIALTLAGYAVARGMSEVEFARWIAGLAINFSASATYDSVPDRHKHLRAEYRYVKSEPKYARFACAFVRALGIPEIDQSCAECQISKRKQKLKEALEKAARALEAASKGDVGAPFQPEILEALALVRQMEPGEWARIRAALKQAKVPLRDLDKVLRRGHLRVVRPDDKPEPVRVREVLPDAPVVAEAVVPPGWRLASEGLARESVREDPQTGEEIVIFVPVAPAPVVVVGRLKDVADGSEATRLAWWRDGRWQQHTAARAVVANARSLVDLAGVGLPVTSNNASDLVQYVAQFEAVNIKCLPRVHVSKQMGWQGEGGTLGFLWGRTLLSPDGESAACVDVDQLAPEDWREDWVYFHGDDLGDEQLADGFHAAGSYEGWVNAMHAVADYPRVLLALYVSLVPPLLAVLDAPNFCVDWSFPTSTGKTTTLRVAASCWGCPDERAPSAAMGTWDATRVWIERASTVLNGLPLILDDTKRAKHPGTVAQVIYDVSSGRGRGRGSPRGMRRAGTWTTVLLSCGEAPATTFTEDGGTRARVLSLWGPPFGRTDGTTASLVHHLNLGIRQHYGHAGPRVVQYVQKNRRQWEAWRMLYQGLQAHYLERAGSDPVAGRYAAYFACLRVAATIAHLALHLPWDYRDPIKALWDDLVAGAKDADRAARALSYVMSWATGNQNAFWGRHQLTSEGEPRVPPLGWAGRWDGSDNWDTIAFLPHRLKKLLAEFGFADVEAILRTWRDRGWLETGGDRNRFTKKEWIAGNSDWAVVIRRDAIERLAGQTWGQT